MAAIMPAAGCDASCQAEATQELGQRLFTPAGYLNARPTSETPPNTKQKRPRHPVRGDGARRDCGRQSQPVGPASSIWSGVVKRDCAARTDPARTGSTGRRRYHADSDGVPEIHPAGAGYFSPRPHSGWPQRPHSGAPSTMPVLGFTYWPGARPAHGATYDPLRNDVKKLWNPAPIRSGAV